MITVTRPWLPDRKRLDKYIDQIYQSEQLTNMGPLSRELEARLADYLGVKHLILVSNGTQALQLSYKALELSGEVITTPFSFVATSNSMAWQGIQPVFADIDPKSLNLDPDQICQRINSQTSAIVPTHVFGNPCDVDAIENIAKQHNLKVVYDAAHCFGIELNQKGILSRGDLSAISFHATKLFHTVEGGAIATDNDELADKIRLLLNFGFRRAGQIELCGINAKMNEFEAAMGLCLLDDMALVQEKRLQIWHRYTDSLAPYVDFQIWSENSENNGAYAPVIFPTAENRVAVEQALSAHDVVSRRYFFPSLDTLPYFNSKEHCFHSRDISERILCLPIYPGLMKNQQDMIIDLVKQNICSSAAGTRT